MRFSADENDLFDESVDPYDRHLDFEYDDGIADEPEDEEDDDLDDQWDVQDTADDSDSSWIEDDQAEDEDYDD